MLYKTRRKKEPTIPLLCSTCVKQLTIEIAMGPVIEAQTDIVQRIYGGDTCSKKEKLNRIGICGIGTRLAGVAILKKLIFANAFTYMHIVHVLNCRDDFAVTYT
ncbi:hypothetical protein LSH36_604g04073 [Paralvinella palmiformis]|uniref:Uncharacterized protein n=1 Tax=Paralvinella palmiformis TaxID=53620 RepID=A0AAD9J4J1_9ANNE|nr:hypothetical protein LSH36_604g04073 [Paralvinella palmiformis]